MPCTDPPEILGYSRNLTVNESFDTNLFCNASGNPPPRILWSLPNGSSVVAANKTFLTFKNTSKSQHGRYSCQATNHVGNSTSLVIYLNVQCKCHTSCASVYGITSIQVVVTGRSSYFVSLIFLSVIATLTRETDFRVIQTIRCRAYM